MTPDLHILWRKQQIMNSDCMKNDNHGGLILLKGFSKAVGVGLKIFVDGIGLRAQSMRAHILNNITTEEFGYQHSTFFWNLRYPKHVPQAIFPRSIKFSTEVFRNLPIFFPLEVAKPGWLNDKRHWRGIIARKS